MNVQIYFDIIHWSSAFFFIVNFKLNFAFRSRAVSALLYVWGGGTRAGMCANLVRFSARGSNNANIELSGWNADRSNRRLRASFFIELRFIYAFIRPYFIRHNANCCFPFWFYFQVRTCRIYWPCWKLPIAVKTWEAIFTFQSVRFKNWHIEKKCLFYLFLEHDQNLKKYDFFPCVPNLDRPSSFGDRDCPKFVPRTWLMNFKLGASRRNGYFHCVFGRELCRNAADFPRDCCDLAWDDSQKG